ncbi:MAG: fumarylacetoacetate hydrolase family protein [Pseudomonadota bacterium]
MHIATYRYRGTTEVGVLSEDRGAVTPFDLEPELAEKGLLGIFEGNLALMALRDAAQPRALGEIELLAPIPRPQRNIFCIGKNYSEHVKEFALSGYDAANTSTAAPESPIVFSKLPQCVIAHGVPIVRNAKLDPDLDYEVELAVIIGKEGRSIPQVDAMDYVWGYTIINDVTARDIQKRHKQWLLGKSQDTFCPMGPVAVTRDGIDLANTPVRCWINDELRQDGNTNQLIFDVPQLIETISAGITLFPGDIIATGTPAGVGVGFEPPKFLVPGDKIRMEIPPIGVLENRVVGA